MNDSDSECSRVVIDGAEHTIIKMPDDCSAHLHLRVTRLVVRPDQSLTSRAVYSTKPSSGSVYYLEAPTSGYCRAAE
ncbi:hypothetical protein HYDPIDRAFT_113638 [Hydnomerulius pinastri MD-312]|uniref:Uncharacterized protein n=1 Tax=Hydnomerulius pinastri MD-312 TaxID=994086 RepID=A0A0C9W7D4_9AGAM|nr:hypothetical protein HYDPIDRAFT_113638 [Hydnomerulius pinastri MD-312]